MPGLHTDYWERTCACCNKRPTRYCRTCDADVETFTDSTSYDGHSVEICVECGSEVGEVQENEREAAMERFDIERKLKWQSK